MKNAEKNNFFQLLFWSYEWCLCEFAYECKNTFILLIEIKWFEDPEQKTQNIEKDI